MAQLRSKSITVTTIADGSATAYFPIMRGRIIQVAYTKVDYTDGIDCDITTEGSAQVILDMDNMNASLRYDVRRQTRQPDGTAIEYVEPVHVFDERVKVVIASGGNVTSGTFTLVYEVV